MKSSIKKSTFLAIYRLLNNVSPLSLDCGTLCGSACCSGETEISENKDSLELGIYLLPGEEKLFLGNLKNDFIWTKEKADNFDFPASWSGKVNFIKCKTPPNCDRKYRPIQCRTFPLAPDIDENGHLSLIIFPSPLPYVCPLIKDNLKLNQKFIKATYTVWKRLIEDPLILDLVFLDSQNRRIDKIAIKTVSPVEK